MTISNQRKEYLYDYKKSKLKRIPLDVQKYTYEIIKLAADSVENTVNGFIKEAIFSRYEYKVAEEALEQQGNDDREQIKSAEDICKNYIAKQIERLEECGEYDNDYINCLYSINRDYMVRILTGGNIERSRLWEKVSKKYSKYIDDIHTFYDSIIEEFDESEYNGLVEFVREEIEESISINISVDDIKEIKIAAETAGESINEFIMRAINETMQRDKSESA